MIKKIAITGPESTGKSELSQQLAREFKTEWVPEYARFYLDRLSEPYQESDLLAIAKGQIAWEEDKMKYASKYLFCDTDLLVIKIWSDFKYGRTDKWIEEHLKENRYDFYLLSDIDISWIPDPQREHPDKRKYFFDLFEDYLKSNNCPYAIVSGIEEDRLANAIKVLKTNQILD